MLPARSSSISMGGERERERERERGRGHTKFIKIEEQRERFTKMRSTKFSWGRGTWIAQEFPPDPKP